ncbi:hypothetical protein V6Z98_001293 [Aspergillus fumigatus]
MRQMIQSDVGEIRSTVTMVLFPTINPHVCTLYTSSTNLSRLTGILSCFRGKTLVFGNESPSSDISDITNDSLGIAEYLLACWVSCLATKVLNCGFKIPATALTASDHTTVKPLTSFLSQA